MGNMLYLENTIYKRKFGIFFNAFYNIYKNNFYMVKKRGSNRKDTIFYLYVT